MKTSAEMFKKGIEKSFGQLKLNTELMKDANTYLGQFKEEKLKGGKGDKKTIEDLARKHSKSKKSEVSLSFLKKQLDKGIKVEMEHTKDKQKAMEIAIDHLTEDPKYYLKLKKIETKEATSSGSSGQFSGPIAFADSAFLRRSQKETKKIEATEATSSSSVGQYSTPAFVAPNKKNWRGAQKPLYKGGQFVKVKRKCLTFPYCNQGDSGALKLSENSSLKNAIRKVAKELNLKESVINNLITYELTKMKKTK